VAAIAKRGADFCAEVEKRTNGRVKITYFPGGSLLGPTDMFDGVVSGIADIGWSHTGYYRDLFPVMDLVTMPLGFTSGWADTHVVNDFWKKTKPKEFADKVHVVVFAGTGPKVLHMRDNPVYKMEDLKGLAIRAPGTAGDIITALGGTPRPTPAPEWYEAVSKGVLDGLNLPYEVLIAWRMCEVTKYTINSWQTGNIDLFFMVMNKDTWNSIPADLQKIINETGEDFINVYGETWIDQDNKGAKAQIDSGSEIIQLSDDEAARWEKAVAPVTENYVKTLVSRGYSETDVRGWIEFLKERIAYWTNEQAKAGFKAPTGPPEVRS